VLIGESVGLAERDRGTIRFHERDGLVRKPCRAAPDHHGNAEARVARLNMTGSPGELRPADSTYRKAKN